MFQVTHSQRLSDSPLNVWVAVQEDGQVLTAHCTCMAGLGECCSHVAATLFYMETVARIANGKTCTSLPCSWLKPAASNTYKEISKIDFTSPARKRKNTDTTTSTSADEAFVPSILLSWESVEGKFLIFHLVIGTTNGSTANWHSHCFVTVRLSRFWKKRPVYVQYGLVSNARELVTSPA